jgi:2-polyprenyl-3-methyl-5-hydroxy-6-metoxy-1,4-benzoquinol methylase
MSLARETPIGPSSSPFRCPACGGTSAQAIGAISRHALKNCGDCSHHFLDATDDLRSELETAYSDHYMGFRPDARFARFARDFVQTQLRPRIAPPALVLDFGCGSGEFLDVLRGAGYQGFGFDLSKGAVRFCVERGLQAETGDFLSWAPPEGRNVFDAVTMWDVLEHLPEPLPYLQRIHSLLRPGGHLFVKTPRVERLSIQCVRLLPRLAAPLLQAPGHLQFFRRESLSRLLERAGFRTLEWLPGQNIKEAKLWRLRSYIRRGLVRTLQTASGDSNNLVFARS